MGGEEEVLRHISGSLVGHAGFVQFGEPGVDVPGTGAGVSQGGEKGGQAGPDDAGHDVLGHG